LLPGRRALAEAWASLDGKLDEFLAGRGGEDTEGDYHGYLSDAAEPAHFGSHRQEVSQRRAFEAVATWLSANAAGDITSASHQSLRL
jgi:hypothetical protein